MTTMMGTLSSILHRLDAYCMKAKPVQLNSSWKDAMRAVSKYRNLEKPKQARPLRKEEVELLVNKLKEPHPAAAFFLVIAWTHAGRAMNVTTLMRRNFLGKDHESVRWDKAKTTATRGPYTTSSFYGPFQALVKAHLATASTEDSFLCSTSDVAIVRKALKEMHKDFDMRSLRRGSLQTMAADKNHTAEQLLVFSGHTTTKSLMRYLGWGEKYQAQVSGSVQVAQCLWPWPTAGTSLSPPALSASTAI